MSFHRFPRTPHVGSRSKVVDDDKVMSCSSLVRAMQEGDVLVAQEKVDGANVSVHFEEEWPPLIQKRSGLVGNGEKRQYDVFRDWVYENAAMLYEVLGTRYCVFGEWLWQQHAVAYDALPSYFLAFDVLEKESGEFLAHGQVRDMSAAAGIETVPLVRVWAAAELKQLSESSLDRELSSLIAQSAFGVEQAEGVYLRVERDGKVVGRAKLRRDTFVAGREDFDRSNVTNSLRDGQ